jgi:hypothetical protein
MSSPSILALSSGSPVLGPVESILPSNSVSGLWGRTSLTV